MHAGLRYGAAPRQLVDIYVPAALHAALLEQRGQNKAEEQNQAPTQLPLAPVAVFVHGGIWVTGAIDRVGATAAAVDGSGGGVCVCEGGGAGTTAYAQSTLQRAKASAAAHPTPTCKGLRCNIPHTTAVAHPITDQSRCTTPRPPAHHPSQASAGTLAHLQRG